MLISAGRRCVRPLSRISRPQPGRQVRRLSMPGETGPAVRPPIGPYAKHEQAAAAAEEAAARIAAEEAAAEAAAHTPPPESRGYYRMLAVLLGGGTGYVLATGVDNIFDPLLPAKPGPATHFATNVSMTNWSGTHSMEPAKYYEPSSIEQLEALVKDAHKRGQKIRPVGTALSPNGLSMCEEGMVSLTHIDKVLKVDKDSMTVTVEAGARVSQVLEALSKHGLTLQNFSSIQEQQMGGWTQVAAHGTGATLPTVEEQIVSMKIISPALGTIELSDPSDSVFRAAKVGLGALGIVCELTLKCIPQHRLLEHTYTTTPRQLRKDHARLLREYRHVRYMWLPYTDTVVVVVSNPYTEGDPLPKGFEKRVAEERKLEGARRLLLKTNTKGLSRDDVAAMSFTELRDQLLHVAPTDSRHVAKVNQVEAQYWKLSAGYRLDESTNILGFDCGGQQWVLEVAFPIGRLDDLKPDAARDIEFVEKLQARIKELNIPAPCPIEQRWTARSTAFMSPACSEDAAQVFSWVGVIMYLPPAEGEEGNAEKRQNVTKEFDKYIAALEPLFEEYGAIPHWAKVEVPSEQPRCERLQKRIVDRYGPGLSLFRSAQEAMDPKGILANPLIDRLVLPPWAPELRKVRQ